jgi:ATP-dependent DNA helicase RecG
MEKLAVMEKTSDGFLIAEEDLRLRGPGDVLGTMQSGLGDLKFADFLADTALLREARALADTVIAEDPMLTGRHAALASMIQRTEIKEVQRS